MICDKKCCIGYHNDKAGIPNVHIYDFCFWLGCKGILNTFFPGITIEKNAKIKISYSLCNQGRVVDARKPELILCQIKMWLLARSGGLC